MKSFLCLQCDAPLAYTDGDKLYFPMQYLNALGRPCINLIEISVNPVILTCGCGQRRKWFRQVQYQVASQINHVEATLILPLE